MKYAPRSNIIDLVRARRKVEERKRAEKVQMFKARDARASTRNDHDNPPPRAA